jgi:hypothetical protein
MSHVRQRAESQGFGICNNHRALGQMKDMDKDIHCLALESLVK